MYIIFGANDYSNAGGINDAEGFSSKIEDIEVCYYVTLHDSYLVLNTETSIMLSVDLCDISLVGESSFISAKGLTYLVKEMAKATDDLSKLRVESTLDNEIGVIGKSKIHVECEELADKEVRVKIYSFN